MAMLASLIAGFASGETALALGRARKAAIAYALAGLAGLLGVGFLMAAATIWASRRYGAIETSLVIGGTFIILGLLVLLIHKLTSKVRAKRAASRRRGEMTTVAVASALAILPTLLRGKMGLGTVIAPALAAVAYAIYRENRRPRTPEPDTNPE